MFFAPRRVRPRNAVRRGFTLIELLVSLTIVAILTALIFPAILGARESSRGVACRSNLKQIALAHANYEDAFGVGIPVFHHPVAVSPFMERAELPLLDIAEKQWPASVAEYKSSSIWLCPSDGQGRTEAGHFSYVPSIGSGRYFAGLPGVPGPRIYGVIYDVGRSDDWRFLSSGEFAGGRSQTAYLSERLIGRGNRDFDTPPDVRDPYYTAAPAGPPTVGWLEGACAEATDRGTYAQDYVNRRGFRSPVGPAVGVAALTGPNGRTCYPGAQPPPHLGFSPYQDVGGPPPTSRHSGCVYVAYADGHVAAVSDSIALSVWRPLNNWRRY